MNKRYDFYGASTYQERKITVDISGDGNHGVDVCARNHAKREDHDHDRKAKYDASAKVGSNVVETIQTAHASEKHECGRTEKFSQKLGKDDKG